MWWVGNTNNDSSTNVAGIVMFLVIIAQMRLLLSEPPMPGLDEKSRDLSCILAY